MIGLLNLKEVAMETKQINAELNWTHVGQYNPYGDTHRICEVHTDENLDEKDILSLVHNGEKLPKQEWKQYNNNILTYFRGYYVLEKTPYGYLYHAVEPYTD